MLILSHRGYWRSPSEKNQLTALDRSFSLGFGVETDIRDYRSKLVISHDMASENSIRLERLLQDYQQFDLAFFLALNIKADGLQSELNLLLEQYDVHNYFVFDMSVPDALGYLQAGLRTFTRQSEYEPQPSFYAQAIGVWMDGFHQDWMQEQDIAQHLNAGKQVCVVSPELHQRSHLALWERLAAMPFVAAERLMLCTDYPEEARKLFHG